MCKFLVFDFVDSLYSIGGTILGPRRLLKFL